MIKAIRLAVGLIILMGLCGCGNGNPLDQSPVISSLTTSEESVNPSGSTQVSVVALDADKDVLTFTWEASGGTISGDGTTVTWTAPTASGAYTIKATASDGRGGTASREVVVDVLAEGNTPPFVKEVTSVPPPPRIWDDETVILTCVAVDPDGDEITSYNWAVAPALPGRDPGTIVGNGNGQTAAWTAPDVPNSDDFTVSVYVTDSRGNRSRTKFTPYTVMCACIRESGGN